MFKQHHGRAKDAKKPQKLALKRAVAAAEAAADPATAQPKEKKTKTDQEPAEQLPVPEGLVSPNKTC